MYQTRNWAGTPTDSIPLRVTLQAVQDSIAPTVERYSRDGYGDLYNSIIRTGSEMLPGVGDLVGLEDLKSSAESNDWGGIGLGLLSAIPGIPAIGKGARGGARTARRGGRLLADAAPAQRAGLLGENPPAYRVARSQDLAPTDTPESLRAQGYEIDPATNIWARTVGTEAPPVDYPIRAYHGSPHSFDRFSLDKIGTGEGAQAYGHGLYFAESEDVARQYRDTLAGDGYLRPDGSVWNPQTLQHMNVRVAANRNGADIEATIARAREVLQRAVESSPPETVDMARADLAELEALRDAGGVSPNPGSMYEVGINADPNTFLDWDRPLSEQPEAVRRALALDALPQKPEFDLDAMLALSAERGVPVHELPEYQVGEQLMDTADKRAWQQIGVDAPHWFGRPEDLPGGAFYEALGTGQIQPRRMDYAPRGSQTAAQRLEALGINGIRYLDGNSRGAGEGSSNYVVFNDELVKILRKYGVSGLGIGAGLGAFGYGQPDNQSLPDL